MPYNDPLAFEPGETFWSELRHSYSLQRDESFVAYSEPPPRPRRNIVSCGFCGAQHYEDTAPGCACAARREVAERLRSEGGRRFGLEIEVEWDESYDEDYCDDYDRDDDSCDCPDCRASRRGERLSERLPTASRIARAIADAGVPCINVGYTHEVIPDAWKVVSDGSLNYGWEIVSPPMQWAQADQIRTVCRVLSELGAEPTDNCGLHVHHDVGDIDLPGMQRLIGRWAGWQRHTDALCADYRVDGQWCGHYNERDVERAALSRDLYGLACEMNRYMSLNVNCFTNYGTVEVRQHESTLDPEEIMAWVAYGQAIIEAAVNDTDFDNVRFTRDTHEFVDALPIPTSRERRLTAPAIRDRLKNKAEMGRYGRRYARAHS